MTLDYDPALPLLPDRCEPGASVRTKGGVRIETNDGELHDGRIVHTVKVLGRGADGDAAGGNGGAAC